MASYSLGEVARIFKISRARLRYWQRTGLVQPTVDDGERSDDGGEHARWGFRDLVCVKAILLLLDSGVPLRRIRRNVDALRSRIPELDQPVGSLRIWLDGSDRVVAHHDGVWMEPDGQTVLDFRLAPDASDDVTSLERPIDDARRYEQALEWFERGCRLDADPATFDEAIEAYERALQIDPEFADAHCNLGTVFYHQGRREAAVARFERAIALDPQHVEGRFNLANLLEEQNRDESALVQYKAVVAADPGFADAHLNLALLYEKLGLQRNALGCWRRYLRHEPEGAWADVARQRVEDEGSERGGKRGGKF